MTVARNLDDSYPITAVSKADVIPGIFHSTIQLTICHSVAEGVALWV